MNKKITEVNLSYTIDNLEYDLVSTDWVVTKVRSSISYRQNLYAALCNNLFQKQDTWPIIKNKLWHCSWRYAGGIIADILQEGDYLDYYCSGIGGLRQDYTSIETDEQWQKRTGFVQEGIVTEEIINDLKKLGWQIIKEN